MAELKVLFGAMGCGKSTQLLQVHHNLERAGRRGLLLTRHDRGGAQVTSRVGAARDAVVVDDGTDLLALVAGVSAGQDGRAVSFVCVDEAQFLTDRHVEQLLDLVDVVGVDVFAAGLLSDFTSAVWSSMSRLLALADVRQELQVEARCGCGRPGLINARLVGGEVVCEGEQVLVGDLAAESGGLEVAYELMCRPCWRRAVAAGRRGAAA